MRSLGLQVGTGLAPRAAAALRPRPVPPAGPGRGPVHGTSPEVVTFHEVGTTISVVAVVGALVALDHPGVGPVLSSPRAAGRGLVPKEHCLLPVPAPATLELLRGVPLEPREVEAELVSPTGVRPHLGWSWRPWGYGAGPRRVPSPNALRVLIGEGRAAATPARYLSEEAPTC
ncbi:MAG: nickel insertion protein [Actinomycetota bacterium]